MQISNAVEPLNILVSKMVQPIPSSDLTSIHTLGSERACKKGYRALRSDWGAL